MVKNKKQTNKMKALHYKVTAKFKNGHTHVQPCLGKPQAMHIQTNFNKVENCISAVAEIIEKKEYDEIVDEMIKKQLKGK